MSIPCSIYIIYEYSFFFAYSQAVSPWDGLFSAIPRKTAQKNTVYAIQNTTFAFCFSRCFSAFLWELSKNLQVSLENYVVKCG